jgi:hypothetical protein
MMRVVRMRRGWRLRLTDNEFEMLKTAVNRGLAALSREEIDALPFKVRKVIDGGGGANNESFRWQLPHGPLIPDEDRRPA